MNLTKFFLDQHGCAKNQVDGELIITHLVSLGLEQTYNPEEAEYIIINSCGFIESAKKESLDAVYSARDEYPNAKIILAGCLSERYAEIFEESLPEVDGIFGNGKIDLIKKVISDIQNKKRPIIVEPQEGVSCGERTTFLSFRGSAFVKITEGCSNHCSFCAIPLIRGELRSRNADDIIEEIKNLVSKGIMEINLIGQDLAAYGTGLSDNVFGTGRTKLPNVTETGSTFATDNKSGLALLLEKISKIEGKFIVRLLYIHPDHFNKDILPIMKSDKRFVPYFDIPFQSGDDKIIKAMNRVGSAKNYVSLVDEIKAVFPEAVIRTTFLTGFPSEDDSAANNTKDFLMNIQSAWSGCFPYSREEDTPAYNMKKRVSPKIAQKRADTLCEIQSKITKSFLKSHIGNEYDILIEEIIEGEDGLAIGRAWFQAPDVDGSVVVRYEKDIPEQNEAVQCGRFVKVKIETASDVDLNGLFICDSENNSSIHDSELKFAPEIQNK